jgi:3-oxoacyl-[acyl-carrier protein] reductase
MLEDLKGKRALVTGSSSGIGAAVAAALAKRGARVAVHYNASAEGANEIVKEIEAAGGEGRAFGADVSHSAEATKLVDNVARHFGGLDILVNNAGAMIKRAPLADLDDDLFDKVVDTNVRSVVMVTKAARPYLAASGAGVIINLSSIAAHNGGGPGASLYAGSKAFVLNMTRSMAKELAPENIRVNGVSPGVIMTPFHERSSSPEWLEAQRKAIPMARIGNTDDAIGVFLFLASNTMSGYITGQTIELNGGQFMP